MNHAIIINVQIQGLHVELHSDIKWNTTAICWRKETMNTKGCHPLRMKSLILGAVLFLTATAYAQQAGDVGGSLTLHVTDGDTAAGGAEAIVTDAKGASVATAEEDSRPRGYTIRPED